MKRYLVLSFSGLLQMVHKNPALLQELTNALFVLGATQNHPADLVNGVAKKKDWMERVPNAQFGSLVWQVSELVAAGVRDGRGSWREVNQFATYARLADTLARHGYAITTAQLEQLPPGPDNTNDRTVYSKRMNKRIKAYLEGLLPDLEVIY